MMVVCSPALDLTRGVARTCTKCGAELAVLLVVVKREKLQAYLRRRLQR
jgi:hypothetical protein